MSTSSSSSCNKQYSRTRTRTRTHTRTRTRTLASANLELHPCSTSAPSPLFPLHTVPPSVAKVDVVRSFYQCIDTVRLIQTRAHPPLLASCQLHIHISIPSFSFLYTFSGIYLPWFLLVLTLPFPPLPPLPLRPLHIPLGLFLTNPSRISHAH